MGVQVLTELRITALRHSQNHRSPCQLHGLAQLLKRCQCSLDHACCSRDILDPTHDEGDRRVLVADTLHDMRRTRSCMEKQIYSPWSSQLNVFRETHCLQQHRPPGHCGVVPKSIYKSMIEPQFNKRGSLACVAGMPFQSVFRSESSFHAIRNCKRPAAVHKAPRACGHPLCRGCLQATVLSRRGKTVHKVNLAINRDRLQRWQRPTMSLKVLWLSRTNEVGTITPRGALQQPGVEVTKPVSGARSGCDKYRLRLR